MDQKHEPKGIWKKSQKEERKKADFARRGLDLVPKTPTSLTPRSCSAASVYSQKRKKIESRKHESVHRQNQSGRLGRKLKGKRLIGSKIHGPGLVKLSKLVQEVAKRENKRRESRSP